MQVGITSYVGTTIFDFRKRNSESVDFDFSVEQDFLSESIYDLSSSLGLAISMFPSSPAVDDEESAAPSEHKSDPDQESDESAVSNGLWYLAMHPRANVREYVAGNSDTPPDCLEYLSKDKHAGVREMVAGHLNCPVPILRKLSVDSNLKVRRAVGANPRTQRDMLRRLSEELDPTIRAAVASNPSSSPETLRLLAADYEVSVRFWVASHAACPREVMVDFAGDASPLVRRQSREIQKRLIPRS
jgi:hypothetical protein